MPLKIDRAGREARHSGGANHQRVRIRSCRNRTGPYAYNLARSKKGAPGIDGVSFETIDAEEGVEMFLEGLAEEVKNKTYQPLPVRRVMIPKSDRSQRPLGIPTIRDRVVQMAVKLMIEPIFEADFCECSYGFRPKRSAHDAVDDVAKEWKFNNIIILTRPFPPA